jgi:hypothetical protein
MKRIQGFALLVAIGISSPALAQSVTLGWDPSDGADGYRLWRGTTSGAYTDSIDVGNVTEYVITDLLPDQTYYFAVQSYAGAASSELSSAITVRIALAPPTSAPFKLLLRNSAGAVNFWSFTGANLYETGALDPLIVDTGWQISTTGDLTGDGEDDILWNNAGNHVVWEMNGNTRAAAIPLVPSYVHPSWRIVAASDLDGDTNGDVVWESTSGYISVWLMNGAVRESIASVTPNYVGSRWLLEAVADMTGDGFTDFVWRSTDGYLSVWEMVGTTRIRPLALSPNFVGSTWKILAARDVNNDGHPDLIWQSLTTNALSIWTMDGIRKIQSLSLASGGIPQGWTVVGVY